MSKKKKKKRLTPQPVACITLEGKKFEGSSGGAASVSKPQGKDKVCLHSHCRTWKRKMTEEMLKC